MLQKLESYTPLKRLENRLNNFEEVCDITHNQDVNTDLILSLCGKKIGFGCYRTVYEYNLNDKYVIKIESENTSHNVSEYILWDEIQGLKGDLAWVRDWFAPILWMSPNGKILVMEKTSEDPKNKKLERPREVPTFFSDLKYDNWGWIGNKFVCHDYQFIHKFIKYEKKMQKVNKNVWW